MALIENRPVFSPYRHNGEISDSSAMMSISHAQAVAVANVLWNLYGLLDYEGVRGLLSPAMIQAIESDHDYARQVHDSLVNLALSLELKNKEAKNA